MAWFGRRHDDAAAQETESRGTGSERTLPDAGDTLDPGASLRPFADIAG